MKLKYGIFIFLLIGMLAIGGCATPSQPTPVNTEPAIQDDTNQEPTAPAMPDIKEAGSSDTTLFGGPTTIVTGIPKQQIVATWINEQDFTSPAEITFLIDGDGKFKNSESEFDFEYKFVNTHIIYLRATSGKTFIDPNIKKLTSQDGKPVTKEYKLVDANTFMIGDLTLTKASS